MTTEFDVIEEILESIRNGTYGVEPDDLYVLDCCRQLREEAERFTALHPQEAPAYLKQRKLTLYQLITRIEREMSQSDQGKRLQLEFLKVALEKLYKFHMELLADEKMKG
uniref:hypothetical protein n=1 Tax=Pedobacter schmidteae TaxID=2201271 RepID=UPI0013CEDD9B|nr:hypothetical protein [Pedobacter schmidteae]